DDSGQPAHRRRGQGQTRRGRAEPDPHGRRAEGDAFGRQGTGDGQRRQCRRQRHKLGQGRRDKMNGVIAGIGGHPPPTGSRVAHALFMALACAALVGCSSSGGPAKTGLDPAARPDGLVRAEAPETAAPDAALLAFYAGVEGDLTASGRMRRETSPSDVPYSIDDLVRNFERIALYDEYVDLGGRFVRQETPSHLRRWEQPVRVGMMTGPSIPPAMAARDRANVAAFTRRLGGLTGLDMAVSEGADVNFLVLFMTNAERIAFADQVRARYPEFAPAVM